MAGIADWASGTPGNVTTPPDSLILAGYADEDIPAHNHFNWIIQQIALAATRKVMVAEAVGPLAAMVGMDLDHIPIESARTISGIILMCPYTPASGAIQVGLWKATSGGSATNLYTSNTPPSLSCNGGYALLTVLSANLPNTLALSAGDILIPRIISAAADAVDLKVMVF